MAKKRKRCPYCNQGMTWEEKDKHPTRDHILPRQWDKGINWHVYQINNFRTVCSLCNILRATCKHCPATLILANQIAQELHIRPIAVLAGWGLANAHRSRASKYYLAIKLRTIQSWK